MSAKDFARMINRSVFTVKALESGRLKLSEELAKEIVRHTGADIKWLLGIEPGPPSLAEQIIESLEKTDARIWPMENRLGEILRRAEKRKTHDLDLALFTVEKFLDRLERDFAGDLKVSESKQPQLEARRD